MIIRHVEKQDLAQLVAIENACFTVAEAATCEAFEKRIEKIADSFFVAEEAGKLVGLVNGPVVQTEFITDELFADITENPVAGGHQTILGLAVAPVAQKRGIAKQLLQKLEAQAMSQQRETITLTCQNDLVPFYEKLGYVNKGQSNSTHGGEVWVNMSKSLL